MLNMSKADTFWELLGLPKIGSIIRYNNVLYRVLDIDDYDLRIVVSNKDTLRTLRAYDSWEIIQS